ncbi:amidohydrolase family protein [Christensenellaceae bacterium OttesenSCG-928-K19]|nr:amidohydrolase family protein [Christensenellaceae bacterium OttesenSCG-928-K19]
MIIDIHTHVGECRVYDEVITEENVLGQMNKYNIDISLVQPLFGTIDMETFRASHDRIYKMMKDNPGRIYGIAAVNPHIKVEDYKGEVRRCVEELGFVGVKLHTNAHACSPDSKDGAMVCETAAELDIPIIIHTGAGIPTSLPINIVPAAQRFPEVKFIASHSGMIIGSGETLLAMKLCDNIYTDISWSVPHHIVGFVEEVGSGRVMFASDEYLNVGPELTNLNDMPISEEDRENISWRTAAKVFSKLPL